MPATGSGVRGHIGWGIAGFLIGAICWHFVGFWDFVGTAVFRGPHQRSPIEVAVRSKPEPETPPAVLQQASTEEAARRALDTAARAIAG